MLANPNNVNTAYRNMIGQYIIYLRLLINQKSSGSIFIFIFLLMFSLEIQHILHAWSSVYEQFGSGASEAQPYREWSMKMFPREPTHTSIPPLCNACTHAHLHTHKAWFWRVLNHNRETDWSMTDTRGYCANANRSSFAFRNLFILVYFYHRLYFFRVLTGSEPRQGIN